MLLKIFPFLQWLPLVKKTWKQDLVAGLTGTVILIPQAIAFAIIAGLPPVYGFYTALVAPVIAAFFGSSYHLVTGPATAIAIVIYASISKIIDPANDLQAYISLTLVFTLMTGIIQLAMGIAKMGKLVNFVSHSVIIGFTAGAGFLIGFKQLKHVFGVEVPSGSTFFEIGKHIISHLNETNWYVFIVAVSTILIAVLVKKYIKPLANFYMLIAMILGSIIALILGGAQNGIQSIGNISASLPPFGVPKISLEKIQLLSSSAFTLALLGLIEAVAISRSVAISSHQKIDNNQEFKGQGLSNIVTSFFSGFAGSGSFSRTAVNFQTGAKTPFAIFFTTVFLGILLLLFSSFTSFLVQPVLGGIILLVSYNLVDLKHIKKIVKSSGRELIVFGVTFLGTLFFDIEVAIFSGILFSLFFYLEKTAKPNIAVLGTLKSHKFINIIRDDSIKECPQLKIIRIDGSIYFGAIEVISDYFRKLYNQGDIKHVLIVANGVNFIDLSGAEWISKEVEKWQKRGGGIYFSGLKIVSQTTLMKGGFRENIGGENFFKDKNTAIHTIYQKLDKNICANCTARIFIEC